MSSKSFFSFFSLFFQYLVASIGIEIDFFFQKRSYFFTGKLLIIPLEVNFWAFCDIAFLPRYVFLYVFSLSV